MADDNRLFRWLGRINSLLFFVGAAGFIVLAGGSVLSVLVEQRGVSHDEPVAAQATNDGYTYEFSAGGLGEATYSTLMTHLDGTDEGIAVLRRSTRGNPYSGLSSAARAYDSGTVNLLSVDLKTMKNRWVFPNVKRDIQSVYQIHASVPVPQNVSDPVTALLMDVADSDTNGDGKITGLDHHALYVYRLAGARPVKLIDAWSISGVQQLDGERIAVTYYDGKTDHAVLISAKDFRVVADTVLAATPK